MLEKDIRVLGGCSVAGVRIHRELGVCQVLLQEERVDWDDDRLLVPMRQSRWAGESYPA